MPTITQLQKAYGNLPNVELKDVASGTRSVDVGGLPDVEQRICGHPDKYDQEIAEADVLEMSHKLQMPINQCAGLIEAHRRMGAAIAPGWGVCHVDRYPKDNALTYFLDLDTFPAHYKYATTREELEMIVEAGVWRWSIEELLDLYLGKPMVEVAYWIVEESYRLVGCAHIRVTDGPNGKHNVHIKSVPIPGSTIGIAWFPNGQCSDHVNHHIDSTYKPNLIGLCKLGCHEFGHNHGEEHQFTGQGTHHGVMSYSPPRLFYGFSTGHPPHSLPKDPTLPSLVRKYGGKAIPLKDKPTPSGDDNRIVIDPVTWGADTDGQPIILDEVTRKGRTFIFRPKPQV